MSFSNLHSAPLKHFYLCVCVFVVEASFKCKYSTCFSVTAMCCYLQDLYPKQVQADL